MHCRYSELERITTRGGGYENGSKNFLEGLVCLVKKGRMIAQEIDEYTCHIYTHKNTKQKSVGNLPFKLAQLLTCYTRPYLYNNCQIYFLQILPNNY